MANNTKTCHQKAILKDDMPLNYYAVLSEVQNIYGICVCILITFMLYSYMPMFNYHCSKKDLQFFSLFYPPIYHILKFEMSFNYICKYNFLFLHLIDALSTAPVMFVVSHDMMVFKHNLG
jgi:hypothetical protein